MVGYFGGIVSSSTCSWLIVSLTVACSLQMKMVINIALSNETAIQENLKSIKMANLAVRRVPELY